MTYSRMIGNNLLGLMNQQDISRAKLADMTGYSFRDICKDQKISRT